MQVCTSRYSFSVVGTCFTFFFILKPKTVLILNGLLLTPILSLTSGMSTQRVSYLGCIEVESTKPD